MSFQHFRLGDLALHQPLQHNIHPVPHHHHQSPQQEQQPSQQQHILHQPVPGQSQFPVQIESPITTFSVSLKKQPHQQTQQASPQPHPHAKQPYGSGDADDGYTLAFINIQEFNEWRRAEEDRTMCEFVKGDTHGSKAVPPRFRDHTKLVCARHSRSGRKKYIKKHPERIRKVPSRKLEVGCPASISYKTYYDTEQVRACYVSQHSHEIGLANLPFTRRGRREAAATKTEKDTTKLTSTQVQNNAIPEATPVPSGSTTTNATNEQSPIQSANVSPQPAASVPPSTSTSFTTAVSMLAPLPSQSAYPTSAPQAYTYVTPVPQLAYPPAPPAPPPQSLPTPLSTNLANDRWENMATLFHSIREHARSFQYPNPSVAALESILIRLYLESPVSTGVQSANMTSMVPAIMAHARGVANTSSVQSGSGVTGGSTSDINVGSAATEDHA